MMTSKANNVEKTVVQKKSPDDFVFGKVIGEGSFSTVFLAKELATKTEYAVKVLDKDHIMKEKKSKYVMREKEVFTILNPHKHPFFVSMFYTFQDISRLYFVLYYAKRGELLDYINKLGCFDETCTRFYSAEIILALEHLHGLNILHRDLKPENVLLDEEMHIKITDFGSAKILNSSDDEDSNTDAQRRNSFVGTAQYVSPEVLNSKAAHFGSDLWALGCIIYQLVSGAHAFYGGHDYQIFQKITKVEYDFPQGFTDVTRDLVQSLIVADPAARLGVAETGGFEQLKSHVFYQDVRWRHLHEQRPPDLLPYLPAKDKHSEHLWSSKQSLSDAGLDDSKFSKLLGFDLSNAVNVDMASSSRCQPTQPPSQRQWPGITDNDRRLLLQRQRESNEFHRFIEGNLVIKQGYLEKRKGLFARRRMFLLTEGPHLYYVDAQAMVLKGEVPWSPDLKPEAKNFKIFFVHTPKRTYYLEDPEGNALKWCEKIDQVSAHYYKSKS